MRQRSQSTAGALQPAVAAANAGRQRRTSLHGVAGGSRTSWGLLDLLGITHGHNGQQAGAAAPTQPAAGASGGAKRASTARSAADGPRGGPVTKMPGETLGALQQAIERIEAHFSQAQLAGSTKTVDVLGNDQKNKDIAVLVRGQLCTALSRVLLHGFKSFKLIGRFHIWDFVQVRASLWPATLPPVAHIRPSGTSGTSLTSCVSRHPSVIRGRNRATPRSSDSRGSHARTPRRP